MKTILIIEDNADVRQNTVEILELADYNVLSTDNGKDGIQLAKDNQVDLILCDITMPGLDGFGVLKILNRNPQTKRIPFIFLTASAREEAFRKGMNLGADDYIVKPYKDTELLDAIEARIQRKNTLSSLGEADKHASYDYAEANELLNELHRDKKQRTYKKKEVIYREGDFANYLYYLVSGSVKTIKTDEIGKDLVNEIHEPGDLFGYVSMLDGGEYHASAIALEDSELALIPKQDLLKLVNKNSAVAREFLRRLSDNMATQEDRLLRLAYTPVRERVALSLLALDVKMCGDIESEKEVSLSREDLAGLVGTTKESLIRTLSDLKKDRLIDTNGANIKILDRERLHQCAHGIVTLSKAQ